MPEMWQLSQLASLPHTMFFLHLGSRLSYDKMSTGYYTVYEKY